MRNTGLEPEIRPVSTVELNKSIVDSARELLGLVDGTIGVITAMSRVDAVRDALAGHDERVTVVDGVQSKGLEYDAVVLVEPQELITESTTGPRTLYVALTRATQRLIVLSSDPQWPD